MTMNHRVVLLRREAGRDSVGQPIDTWAALPAIWADVRFQTGAEVLRAGAETTIVKASIRIRARTDVTAAMHVRYLGVEYDIKSALPDSKDRQFMFLVCESVS